MSNVGAKRVGMVGVGKPCRFRNNLKREKLSELELCSVKWRSFQFCADRAELGVG